MKKTFKALRLVAVIGFYGTLGKFVYSFVKKEVR